ncbi:MAG: type II secretion system F family protein [Simkaniaceae bacterium]|nr:type II secretion system F family protein [Simkaniaceae bacterium]
MSLFQYQAITNEGKTVKGDLSAESIEMAKEILLKRKVLITAIKKKSSGYQKKMKLSSSQLLGFTGEMAQLLKAGLPLYDALVTIEEKYQSTKHHPLFLELRDSVGQGRALSHAMGQYPKLFGSIYISMVASGEETATLPFIFEQLTETLTKQSKLKKQLSSAMVYPAFLGVFCLVVVVGLFVFLIPSMKDLLDDRPLHPMTQNVLLFSDFLTNHPLAILSCLSALVLSVITFCKSKKGKQLTQKLLLRLPLIGTLITQSVLVRFSRAFAVLLASGVPVMQALELAQKVMHHPEFEQIIEKVKVKMVEGRPLSEELANHPLIPSVMTRMIATGEASGNLEKMLLSLSEMYQEELEKSLATVMNLLQPVMILFLGLIVGFVLLSVLLPLTDVSSFLN